jgi:hypothetical protein
MTKVATTKTVFDRDFFVKSGQRGGKATKKKHGVAHFRKIGRSGGRPRKEEDENGKKGR